MSYFFGADPQGKQQQLDTLMADWDGQNDFDAGAGTGILKGAGMGIMRGGAKVADLLQTVGSVLDAPGTDSDRLNQTAAEFRKASVNYWTPSASEVGKVGQVLGSVGEMALPLMATAGNPAILGASVTLDTGKNLIDQGVDAKTAGAVGLAEGGATMLGAWLPMLGGNLAQRVMGNAAANVVVGGATAAAEHEILAGTGYDQQAAQFDPFDLQARVVDALMGAAFGAISRGEQMGMREAVFGVEGAATMQRGVDSMMESLGYAMKPSDMDAAFSAANIKHFQIDSAVGRPVNSESWRQHGDAIETALEQLSRGDPVDVTGRLDGAEFKPRAQTADSTAAMDDVLALTDDLDEPANLRAIEPQVMPEPIPATTGEAAADASRAASPADAAKAEADIEVAAVQQHIDQHGDFDVAIAAGDDAEGSTVRPASQLLEEADAAAQEANTIGQGIIAAAKCFIGLGT